MDFLAWHRGFRFGRMPGTLIRCSLSNSEGFNFIPWFVKSNEGVIFHLVLGDI